MLYPNLGTLYQNEGEGEGEHGTIKKRTLPKSSSRDNTLIPDIGGKMDPPDEDSLPPTLIQDPLPMLYDEVNFSIATQGMPLEDSEQSLTQANDMRRLDDRASHHPSHNSSTVETQQSAFEPRTLDENDTGAVNFTSIGDFQRPSSPISVDAGFENARSEWRVDENRSRQFNQETQTPFKTSDAPPETPALPKNPFAAKNDAAVPFAGTQLFGQTQLMTSAIKNNNNSPTSSRPSPNLFHNSISPNFMETSPLKRRTNVSSPTTIRTSSPQRLQDIPATIFKSKRIESLQEETPLSRRSQKTIPESPTVRLAGSFQPMAHYEPMQKSQERKTLPVVISLDSELDDDVIVMERRTRIERMKAQAAQEMGRVSVERNVRRYSSSELPEIKRRRLTDDDAPISASDDVNGIMPEVGDSQRPPVQSLESTKATPRDEDEPQNNLIDNGQATTADMAADTIYEDVIPATSPVHGSPALLEINAGADINATIAEPELPAWPDEAQTSSSAPTKRRQTRATKNAQRTRRRNWVLSSSASAMESEEKKKKKTPTILSDKVQLINTDSTHDDDDEQDSDDTTVPADGLRSHTPNKAARGSEPRNNTSTTNSSALTSLSNTPNAESIPESTSRDQTLLDHTAAHSPSLGRSLRRRLAAAGNSAPTSPRRTTRLMTAVDRFRSEPGSDADSPSTSLIGSDLGKSRPISSFSNSAVFGPRRKARLFQGMVFAISLVIREEKETQKDMKGVRDKIERQIEQSGGRVLQKGFHELLQQPAANNANPAAAATNAGKCEVLKLQTSAIDYGFAAVITNGHSRSFKYMEALALGIPCLPRQWISACLKRGDIVDWRPYLLSSGSSAVLGNTTLSRWLPSYSAIEVRLADIIIQRPRILEGRTLLIVADTAKNIAAENILSPSFLAQGLGATIVKVSTVRQAKEAMRKAEQAANPFDWLCAEHSSEKTNNLLGSQKTTTNGKKRKWQEPAPHTRLLHDELVIQSLILGRMVELEEEKCLSN